MLKLGIIIPDIQFRIKLEKYISTQSDMKCLLSEDSIYSALCNPLSKNSQPEILLFDQDEKNHISKNIVGLIKDRFNNPSIIILGSVTEKKTIIDYFKWGIKGYILKDEQPDDIMEKIRTIKQGGLPLSPGITREIINYLQKDLTDKNVIKNRL